MSYELASLPESLLIANTPAWVVQETLPNLSSNSELREINVLLEVCQYNLVEKQQFYHRAYQLIDQEGVQHYSSFFTKYDPLYQKVLLHTARIIRNGEIIDKLAVDKVHVIQEESELENYQYDGKLSVRIFFDDVREDDIIEWSYSIQGFNPLFKHFSKPIMLQGPRPVQKRMVSIISNEDHKFNYKTHKLDIFPEISTFAPGLKRYVWRLKNIEGYVEENDMPKWWMPEAVLEVSDYSSWEEVIKIEKPLYEIPQLDTLPKEMKELVDEWKQKHGSKKEQALVALRFVQDKVRYLGFEEGVNSNKPHEPVLTFNKRYGDCKDKVQLLRTFLALCDIESDPVLVNTNYGKILDQFYPSHTLFNHAIIRITIDDDYFFADPTVSLQGGSLEDLSYGNLGYGLIINNNIKNLFHIPLGYKSKIKQFTTIKLDGKDEANILIETEYSHASADNIRRFYKKYNLEKISKQYVEWLSDFYGPLVPLSNIQVDDNRSNNLIKITQKYLVQKFISDDNNERSFSIRPLMICEKLDRYVAAGRSSPMQQEYEDTVEECFRITRTDGHWSKDFSSHDIKNEFYHYENNCNLDSDVATVNFFYKSFTDHIPIEKLYDYQKSLEECANFTGFTVQITNEQNTDLVKDNRLFPESFPLIIAVITFFVSLSPISKIITFLTNSFNSNKT